MIVKLGLALVSRKLNKNKSDPQNSDFNAGELVKKTLPLWSVIIGVILTVLSAKGYIDPVIYEALKGLLSNPAVIDAVNSATQEY